MSRIRPLPAMLAVVVAYASWWLVAMPPAMLAHELWSRSVSSDAAELPLALGLALFAVRAALLFAIGYFAHPVLKSWVRSGETVFAVLFVSATLSALIVVAAVSDFTVLRLAGLVPLAGLALGSWIRYASTSREPGAAV